MKLSLSKEAREARKKKIIKVDNVVSAQSKLDEVTNLSSDFALELSEAKSEISRLKQEIVNQQVRISNNFKAMRRDEIRATNNLFEEEKCSLIHRLSQEHRQRIFEINKEHEQKLNEAVLQAITVPKDKPKIRNSHQSRYDAGDSLDELDRQYDRDNGHLDPAPYDTEHEW